MKLVQLGYTEREAAFLQLASLLSGYFLRSHFNKFIGGRSGAVAQRFIERGLTKKHFKLLPAPRGRLIYHIAASAIYRALGDENNRNRREHRAEAIRRRLMSLDFALEQEPGSLLLSEPEKVEHFTKLGIPKTNLPSTSFDGTVRCFVDKQPLGIQKVNGFCRFAFIDEGSGALSQWEMFLKGHRPLLGALPSAEVIFASTDESRFGAAEKLFRRTVAGETPDGRVDSDRLQAYFHARRDFEQRRFELFDQARLDEFRENKRVFGGPEGDALYANWHSGNAFKESRQVKSKLSTFVLPHFYEWLSPFRLDERRATLCP